MLHTDPLGPGDEVALANATLCRGQQMHFPHALWVVMHLKGRWMTFRLESGEYLWASVRHLTSLVVYFRASVP